ncbi:MAG: DUF937 domain-containing protein [Rhodospirillales bacterium]|nr:DUF937 domain-containing protein [Alphaproteobacteria bacterium]MCB1839505.1 DUF937 domain-containing protein [Alphaproteobacteria bacterium]MCB9977669.1 DUF937 domain-containing protein [Rhodospirillales bacterium]
MNNFLDLINYAAQRPEMIRSLAGQFGLDQKQTDNVSKMLISAVAGGMLNNIQNGGLENLMGALENGQHEKLLEKAKAPGANLFNVIQEGNDILGHILGSKDVSRQVAGAVEQKTNVEAEIIKTMLPIIAAVVMGMLDQTRRKQGNSQFSGSLLNMLDMNHDGSPVDDIIRLVGSLK